MNTNIIDVPLEIALVLNRIKLNIDNKEEGQLSYLVLTERGDEI